MEDGREEKREREKERRPEGENKWIEEKKVEVKFDGKSNIHLRNFYVTTRQEDSYNKCKYEAR